jgi:antitoxin MazE
MRARVAKWGNSAALRLPKVLVDELGLQPGQEVELVLQGREARLKPIRPFPVYRIEDLVAEMKRLGPQNEPPLEDWGAVEAPWPDDEEGRDEK